MSATASPAIDLARVPAEAMRLEAGPCVFEAADADAGVPVRILARTGKPISHWYWGKIVHDLSGMHLHKKRLTIDYNHRDDEILGYLDRFEVVDGDLFVSGRIVPFADKDRASEVIYKARSGVPYEASIYFSDPLRLEELDDETEAEVNGYVLQGPAIIIREWSLRNTAICPHGMDRNTSTQLKTGDTIALTLLGDTDMATKLAATKTTAAAKEETPLDAKAELKRYMEAFGDPGAQWFADDKTFEEAQQLHLDGLQKASTELTEKLTEANTEKTALTEQVAALTTERDELTATVETLTADNKRLKAASADASEGEAVSFAAADDSPEARQQKVLAGNLGDNMSRYVRGMRMPGRAAERN